jgi:hypothetical protein
MEQMTVREALMSWTTMPDETRRWAGEALYKLLSPVSHASLLEFQKNWDGARPFAEFCKEQQTVFKMCMDLETSEMGKAVREATNMHEELTWDTILEKPERYSVPANIQN